MAIFIGNGAKNKQNTRQIKAVSTAATRSISSVTLMLRYTAIMAISNVIDQSISVIKLQKK
jgi:hypothetical protein